MASGIQIINGETYSGTCGDNLTWQFESDGTLRISGTGEMYDYSGSSSPWSIYSSSVKKVVIDEGVTTLSNRAFYYCNNMTTVSIPGSVYKVDDLCFWMCTSLTEVCLPEGVTIMGSNVFLGCYSLRKVTLPSSLSELGSSNFRTCLQSG